MARKSSPPATPAPVPAEQGRGLDVATVVPWIAFWGWVALDSALAYRKSQTAQEPLEDSIAVPEIPDAALPVEPRSRPWSNWSFGARAAMIGAPIVAMLGPLLLDRLMRRRKP
ncbi:MAG TPA: hypothetical protein VG960_09585 [Caulobacteraceae bacterium]|nr:hypothetical protein [Caulobacteraceae bacterium]